MSIVDSLRLDGKVAIVTGASSGLGVDFADALAEAGADVAVCARVAQPGRVDVLVNNAGIGTAAPATREDPEDFRRVIDINLMGSYWMAQACGRAMKEGGSIVNIGSVARPASSRPRCSSSPVTPRPTSPASCSPSTAGC